MSNWRQNLSLAIRPPRGADRPPRPGSARQAPAATQAAGGAAGTQAQGVPAAGATGARPGIPGLRRKGAGGRRGAAKSQALAQAADRGVAPSELAQRKEQITAQLVELQWDLGGLAYEMARRDHFRLDVLVRQAAKLQEADAELGGIDHMLSLEQAGAAGTCPSCGALHARGAVYCWQCGHALMQREQVSGQVASPSQSDGAASPSGQVGSPSG